MWNQPQTLARSTYYSYSSKRKQQLAKYARYKLLILLVSKGVYRVMRDSLSHVVKVGIEEQMAFEKMWNHMNRHVYTAQKMVLQKLKQNVIVSRGNQTVLKNMVTLLERLTKYKIKKTFSMIMLHAQRKNHMLVENIDYMRKIVFCRKIQKVFGIKRKEYFGDIKNYANWMRNLLKRVRTMSVISNRYIKNVKQQCFMKLMKNMITQRQPTPQSTPHSSSYKQIQQKKNFQSRITTLQQSLEQKHATICRLQQQILQLKMQQSSPNYNSFSQYSNYNSNPPQRNKTINKRRQNESMDSGLDFSIGSILGNSFSLNHRSRSKQIRKNDSVVSGECNCSYKEKYLKMKGNSDSLKNQLQIVKEELEVAKDLNDHFTNEIRQYFGGEKQSIELDRLKKEVRDLQKDREQMRMKITKYQNHIMTLKSEFKIKIEELYRKVKKER